MLYKDFSKELAGVFDTCLTPNVGEWLSQSIYEIINEKSTRKLYLTYTLCSSKITNKPFDLNSNNSSDILNYLHSKRANSLEFARVYLLSSVLNAEHEFFKDKVINLIQIADTQELETFLKFLVLLPNAKDYVLTAVEGLRTNIASVFEAIALNNPYPSIFFNEQQWNQMYLKAAFMQLDLSQIMGVDKMANKNLSRIISDYAHERWAASRNIDPVFWRPVSNFLEGALIEDMKHLFESNDTVENRAAALVCFGSKKSQATELLQKHPHFQKQLENQTLTWNNIKE